VLQRLVKNGLTDKAALAFLEAGFADRVVATALGQAWPGVRERGDVRAICRDERGAVHAILDSMPSYFLGRWPSNWQVDPHLTLQVCRREGSVRLRERLIVPPVADPTRPGNRPQFDLTPAQNVRLPAEASHRGHDRLKVPAW